MTLTARLAAATRRLKESGVADPARDARVLLAAALGIDRTRLTLMGEDDVTDAQFSQFERMVSAREKRQPVAQIIGKREFFGLEFTVTPDVLDPRPETEHLVEIALEKPFESVLDIGLGSGCILLTLLHKTPDSRGVGCDVSAAALKVAAVNAKRLGIEGRAEFVQSNWLDALPEQRFDLIVSNPPYIAADAMQGLAPEVRDWEPEIALTPGGDGLEPYRIITQAAPRWLNKTGRLIVEIGFDQGEAVAEMFANEGFVNVRISKDYAGHDRVISGDLT
ncbi:MULTISPECIES: peptide chain release factor N(5)-glutamine methyltransferase [Halocynthiibacter]|uniref:Release factor glutamine methyltransferase n=1 Tax=Halocynthiibacter halioticoli TaxID=2986804 RepID=A0AAE3IYI7_9RHOB|nr:MULTISPECIES: peptide chain release factor N(5)-glutamine methyltransferase [Halocynthiibacter]MCV6824617.1 peptide chain release factor N(5)-glutamine methyltransferase [Halocynthiibacter halioticoli]MCW4057618.1 peptide chain release factor N(5)-glutamine methyltransferase [Halocynthiibacter sp. SDUM655004]